MPQLAAGARRCIIACLPLPPLWRRRLPEGALRRLLSELLTASGALYRLMLAATSLAPEQEQLLAHALPAGTLRRVWDLLVGVLQVRLWSNSGTPGWRRNVATIGLAPNLTGG